MATNDPNFDFKDGFQGLSRFNIGTKEFSTVAVCKDYGTVWRRDFAEALKRGAVRFARY